MRPTEITEILNRPISQELLARDVTRLAYVAPDGTPRNIPIAFTWNGSEIVMCTTKNAPMPESLIATKSFRLPQGTRSTCGRPRAAPTPHSQRRFACTTEEGAEPVGELPSPDRSW